MITFACAGCQASYTVSDERAGKAGKCPKCQTTFTVPQPAPKPAPPPAPAPVPRDELLRPAKPEPRDDDEDDTDDEDGDDEPRPRDDESDPPAPAFRRRRKRVVRPSSLDGALGNVRLSHYLDLFAALALLLSAAGLYFGVIVAAGTREAEFQEKLKAAAAKYSQDYKEWTRDNMRNGVNGRWQPPPVPPAILDHTPPTQDKLAEELLFERFWLRLLPILPAALFSFSGLVCAIGRFRLAAGTAGSGGSRAFWLTGFIALGRVLAGAGVAGLLAWTAINPDVLFEKWEYQRAAIRGLLYGFPLTLYCGILGEVFALPALALVGWNHGTTDEQRQRIGTAAAFYPLLVLVLFSLSVTVAALVYSGISIPPEIGGGVAVVVFAAIFLVQFLVAVRAYRFPLKVERVS